MANVKILAYGGTGHGREFLEAWYSTAYSINRCIELAPIYAPQVKKINFSTGILEEGQISDSKTKNQGTAESLVYKGHKPEPSEVNDRGHLRIDQSTRAEETRLTIHVVIDQSGHRMTEQTMEPTDRTTNRDRRLNQRSPQNEDFMELMWELEFKRTRPAFSSLVRVVQQPVAKESSVFDIFNPKANNENWNSNFLVNRSALQTRLPRTTDRRLLLSTSAYVDLTVDPLPSGLHWSPELPTSARVSAVKVDFRLVDCVQTYSVIRVTKYTGKKLSSELVGCDIQEAQRSTNRPKNSRKSVPQSDDRIERPDIKAPKMFGKHLDILSSTETRRRKIKGHSEKMRIPRNASLDVAFGADCPPGAKRYAFKQSFEGTVVALYSVFQSTLKISNTKDAVGFQALADDLVTLLKKTIKASEEGTLPGHFISGLDKNNSALSDLLVYFYILRNLARSVWKLCRVNAYAALCASRPVQVKFNDVTRLQINKIVIVVVIDH
ncbi:hypothetical protein CLF_108288 [Clonorchis sinensis]|uniref:Uncharacterized protein n=1 Tax=Clonorchis sinensis TaxID=79923 RepID=G7YHV2_CLOSI|nr:hypothetical protein CLF_108288 [Clonorchis sinensis]